MANAHTLPELFLLHNKIPHRYWHQYKSLSQKLRCKTKFHPYLQCSGYITLIQLKSSNAPCAIFKIRDNK